MPAEVVEASTVGVGWRENSATGLIESDGGHRDPRELYRFVVRRFEGMSPAERLEYLTRNRTLLLTTMPMVGCRKLRRLAEKQAASGPPADFERMRTLSDADAEKMIRVFMEDQ